MATTYYLDTGNLLQLDAPSDATQSVDTAVGATTNTNYTHADSPSTDGITGDYSAAIVISAAATDHQVSVAWARVNSAGTQQSISSFTSEQQSAVGTLNFSATSVNLGTWVSGDRLRVVVRTRDTRTMGGGTRTTTYDYGSAGSTTAAPWTFANPVNINLAPAAVAAAGQTVAPGLGALSTDVTPATSAAAASVVDTIPASLDVDLTPSTGNATASTVDPTFGSLSTDLTPAAIAASASVVDPQEATTGVNVDLTPAGASVSSQTVQPVLDALSVDLTPASMSAAGSVVDPQEASPGVNISLTVAAVTTTATQLAPVVGVDVALVQADITATGSTVTPDSGPVTITLAPAGAASTAEQLLQVDAGIDVTLTVAAIAAAGSTTVSVYGPTTTPLEAAVAAAGASLVDPQITQPVAVAAVPAVADATAGVLEVTAAPDPRRFAPLAPTIIAYLQRYGWFPW